LDFHGFYWILLDFHLIFIFFLARAIAAVSGAARPHVPSWGGHKRLLTSIEISMISIDFYWNFNNCLLMFIDFC